MQCTSCKTPLLAGMTVCPRCGTSVSSAPSAFSYTSYGYELDSIPYFENNALLTASATVQSSQEPAQMAPSQGSSHAVQSSVHYTHTLPRPQQSASIVTPPQLHSVQRSDYQTARLSTGWVALFTTLAFLLIGASVITYFVTVLHPAELTVQATTVARNFLTSQARATAHANVQATIQVATTATALQNVYTQATSGQPMFTDSLRAPGASYWGSDSTSSGGCAFTGGAYHVKASVQNAITTCAAQIGAVSNFAFQIQTTLLQGDYAGIVFRLSQGLSNELKGYFFTADITGSYSLFIFQNNRLDVLTHGFSPAIKTNHNASNLLAVVVRSNTIYMYVNDQYIDSISDTTYQTGQLGLFAYNLLDPTDATFSNAQVWKL